jgi:hypothetical protein
MSLSEEAARVRAEAVISDWYEGAEGTLYKSDIDTLVSAVANALIEASKVKVARVERAPFIFDDEF